MMMALHVWALSHGIASLFGRGDAASRTLPMAPEELLEAGDAPLSARPRSAGLTEAVRRHSRVGLRGALTARPTRSISYVNVIYIHTRGIAMPITAKLDEFGKPAWIVLTILGFMIWWPVGFAVLAFVIGSGRMGCGYRGGSEPLAEQDGSAARAHGGPGAGFSFGAPSSGNRAFDEYRSETIRRLEDEQREFQRLPRSAAHGQGQVRVRPVHGGAA